MRVDTAHSFNIISPINGEVYYETQYADTNAIESALQQAKKAQTIWQKTSLQERIKLLQKFLTIFKLQQNEIAEEICWQMGRPIKQAAGEVDGVIERSEHMITCAEAALADVEIPEKAGFVRFIRKEAVGTVFVIAPWNFPYLTAINTIIPALLAGNTVLLKHASQTAKCAERLFHCLQAAGLPAGVFQYLHLTHDDASSLLKSDAINFVAFTGSVAAGRKIQKSLLSRFIGAGFELGGKDAAYVREDADLDSAIEGLVDGAMFNSGQSCCGIERIYVHKNLYKDFIDGFVDLTKKYNLDNPLNDSTTLGPVVNITAANTIRFQIEQAVLQGATALIDKKLFANAVDESAYLAPQVLIDCDQQSSFMQDETFGPVVGILSVESDEKAMQYINDSQYGLTASVWTKDLDAAITLGEQAEVGTWFMNRCDYLDPALAWTGVKDTGYGVTLSELGYQQLTRVKSYHLKK